MEWPKIATTILAFLTAFLLPFFLSKRKKQAPKKIQEFSEHLLGMGVKFDELDKKNEPEKLGIKLSMGQKPEGLFALKDRNIDLILVFSVSSQYGVNYFIEYLVKSNFDLRKEPLRKTKMEKKKNSIFGKEVVDIVWKGDRYLSQRLNMDYEIKHKLMQAFSNKFKGGIVITPDPKHGYTRIKTNYSQVPHEVFGAIDSIARYIKSGI
ncbi:MAG: hypothetical protein JSV96_07670 [Candidatus Aminicenantes bacterium]|nr:MAG: hypothetical protein JSV96_07670 [Candidatus Aminicenantes bacterium]